MADKAKAAKMLALGSWHVYNRQTFEESVAFVNAALERGINHFDMADYWESDFKNTERFKAVMKELGRSTMRTTFSARARLPERAWRTP